MIFPDESQTKRSNAHHCDSLSDFYLDICGEHVHHGLWLYGKETADEAVLRLITVVADEARIGAGTRVCDIGCGYGALRGSAARRFIGGDMRRHQPIAPSVLARTRGAGPQHRATAAAPVG